MVETKQMASSVVDMSKKMEKKLLSISENDGRATIENEFYSLVIDLKNGRITSLKDKRTKNFHREIVQQGKELN